MNSLRYSATIAAAMLPFAAAVAQPAQTAEGAQKFLAAVTQNGTVKAYVVGDLKVRHLCTKNNVPWEGHCAQFQAEMTRRYDFSAETIQPGPTACITKVRSFPVNVGLHDVTDTSWLGTVIHKFEPLDGVAPIIAIDIDWGKAVIKRGGWWKSNSYLEFSRWHPETTNNLTVELGDKAVTFASDEPEMLDRIEYAMKFLKLSCDATADTGF